VCVCVCVPRMTFYDGIADILMLDERPVGGMTTVQFVLWQLKTFRPSTWQHGSRDDFWRDLQSEIASVQHWISHGERLLDLLVGFEALETEGAPLLESVAALIKERAQWLQAQEAVEGAEKHGHFWLRVRSMGAWPWVYSSAWRADWDHFFDQCSLAESSIRNHVYLQHRRQALVAQAPSTRCPSSIGGTLSEPLSWYDDEDATPLGAVFSERQPLEKEKDPSPSAASAAPPASAAAASRSEDVPAGPSILVVLPGLDEDDKAYVAKLLSTIRGRRGGASVHVAEVESLQAFRSALVQFRPELVYFEALSSEPIWWIDRNSKKAVEPQAWAETVLSVMEEWTAAEGRRSGLVVNTAGASLPPQTRSGLLDAVGWAVGGPVPSEDMVEKLRELFFREFWANYKPRPGLVGAFPYFCACSVLQRELGPEAGTPLLNTWWCGALFVDESKSATARGPARRCLPGVKVALPNNVFAKLRMPLPRKAGA